MSYCVLQAVPGFHLFNTAGNNQLVQTITGPRLMGITVNEFADDFCDQLSHHIMYTMLVLCQNGHHGISVLMVMSSHNCAV